MRAHTTYTPPAADSFSDRDPNAPIPVTIKKEYGNKATPVGPSIQAQKDAAARLRAELAGARGGNNNAAANEAGPSNRAGLAAYIKPAPAADGWLKPALAAAAAKAAAPPPPTASAFPPLPSQANAAPFAPAYQYPQLGGGNIGNNAAAPSAQVQRTPSGYLSASALPFGSEQLAAAPSPMAGSLAGYGGSEGYGAYGEGSMSNGVGGSEDDGMSAASRGGAPVGMDYVDESDVRVCRPCRSHAYWSVCARIAPLHASGNPPHTASTATATASAVN